MKTKLTVVCLYALTAFAANQVNVPVTLLWDDPNTDGDVSGYRLYLSATPGVYGTPILCSTPIKVVYLPLRTIRYARVTIVSLSGVESLPSDELGFLVEKPKPGNQPKSATNLRTK